MMAFSFKDRVFREVSPASGLRFESCGLMTNS